MGRGSRRAIGAAALAAAFLLMTVLVAQGVTASLDARLRDVFRPDDTWGPLQVRVDVVVEGLKPVRALAVFAVLVLGLALLRWSWAPLVYAVVLLAVAGVPALVTKVTMARTDPHHELSSLGAFPSGHVTVLLVCLGGALLLVREVPRFWEWCCVGAVVAMMALALLLQAAHWFSDVLAGGLLGTAALAATTAQGWLHPTGSRADKVRDT